MLETRSLEQSVPETRRRKTCARCKARSLAEAYEVITPGDGLPEASRLEKVEAGGAIGIMVHVVFTRPEKLDRHADNFSDPCRFDRRVVHQPPAKPATNAWQINRNVAGQCRGSSQLAAALVLAFGWEPRSRACRSGNRPCSSVAPRKRRRERDRSMKLLAL